MIVYLWARGQTLSLVDPDPSQQKRVKMTFEETIPLKTVQELLSAAIRSSTDDQIYVIDFGGR